MKSRREQNDVSIELPWKMLVLPWVLPETKEMYNEVTLEVNVFAQYDGDLRDRKIISSPDNTEKTREK